jgi:hypothetical protein
MIYRYYAETGGWRFVVLFHEGRTWLKLLDVSRLEVCRIAKDQHRHLVPYTEVKPTTLARWLRQRRTRMKRCHVSFPEKAVQSAIRTLEGTS